MKGRGSAEFSLREFGRRVESSIDFEFEARAGELAIKFPADDNLLVEAPLSGEEASGSNMIQLQRITRDDFIIDYAPDRFPGLGDRYRIKDIADDPEVVTELVRRYLDGVTRAGYIPNFEDTSQRSPEDYTPLEVQIPYSPEEVDIPSPEVDQGMSR